MTNIVKKYFSLAVIVMVIVIVGGSAYAQTIPDFMVTWKAGNYAPADYPGKILPIDGTSVEVALELVSNGKLADLSSANIRWSVNGDFYKSGIGLKTISFNADGAKGDQTVDISLNYRGQALDKRVSIPLAKPEVVIAGGEGFFQALLYFFNLGSPNQAKFTWTVNNNSVESTGQNPDILAAGGNIPSGTVIELRVEAQNLLKPLEVAGNALSFTTQ